MILFWDKNLPKSIPMALQLVKPTFGADYVGVEYYLQHFPLSDRYPEGGDDRWLHEVGAWGWIVITQDWHLHTKQNELFAIKQHKIGCFYMWGARNTKWEVIRCFFRAYNRIIAAASSTQKPFIYSVTKTGLLSTVEIP